MSALKVSVILPIYNVEQYLPRALNSLLSQTFKDMEIICVNDCSPDGCLAIIEKFCQTDRRIRLINLPANHGQGYCRNLAIEQAQGDYIMFLDPDDWLEDNAIEVAYNQIWHNQNDFVMFGFNSCYEDTGEVVEQTYWLQPFAQCLNEPNIKLSSLKTNYMQNAYSVCRIYSRSFLNRYNIRYSDDRIDQDNIFVVNAFISADNISLIPQALYNYRIHKRSTSFNTKLWQGMIDARRKSYCLLQYRQVNASYMRMFLQYLIPALCYWMKRFSAADAAIAEDLYNYVRRFFQQIAVEQPKHYLRNVENYAEFCHIIRYPYGWIKMQAKLLAVLRWLFEVRNIKSGNVKHKLITILGFRFEINHISLSKNPTGGGGTGEKTQLIGVLNSPFGLPDCSLVIVDY